MRAQVVWSLAVGLALPLVSGPAWAQADAKVTQAIEQLGSESPSVRARARATIVRAGESAVALLLSEIAATEDVPLELLFVTAEDIGRERRGTRFTLRKDLGEKGWRIEWRSGGKELALLQDHGGEVKILNANFVPTGDRFGTKQTAYFALDPKDKTFAYNDDGTVVIAARNNGRRVRIPGADTPSMAYSPDGRQLATAGFGRVVSIWSVADGTRMSQFAVDGAEGGLNPVFSPDGKLLVVGNRNDKTHVFDVLSGKKLQVLDRAMSQQIAFSPDGSLLAVAYVDGMIGIWNPTTGTLEKLLNGEVKEVFTVAWSPDGNILTSAGLSGPIVIWSRKHLAKLTTLEPGSDRTFRLAFRPDGKMLVAAGNQTTRAWIVESGN